LSVDIAWTSLPFAEFEATYRPSGHRSRTYLHRAMLRALEPALTRLPTEAEISHKPLVVDLALPLPSQLRVYVFEATQHHSERQLGTFKIQLTTGVAPVNARAGRLHFDRGEGVRPIVMGYVPDLRVFILWDADLHDLGEGFAWSKNVQAPPDLIWEAVANGLALGARRMKKPTVTERIVAARPHYLTEALRHRIRLSNETLCEGVS
jgi:hypothetical protein